jgi:hypothetical protein
MVSGLVADAVFIDGRYKTGARMVDRAHSILRLAKPFLGVDPASGEVVHMRIQPGNRLFVTRDRRDTILFPHGDPRAGRPRYRWIEHAPGIELGYLVEGAHESLERIVPPPPKLARRP